MPSAERAAERPLPSQPLDSDIEKLPKDVAVILLSARTGWLTNREVLNLLQCHRSCNLNVSREPPSLPVGGTVFLYDRGKVKSFRKDGHNWKKKKDGKTVRETHEKLKVDNREVLNCYYAHPEFEGFPQRRCYWQLDGKPDIVLVHYLVIDGNKASPAEVIGSHTQGSSSPGQSCGSVQGLSFGDVHQDNSEGAQSMSGFEGGNGLMRDTPSSPHMKSPSMGGCLELLQQQRLEPLVEQHRASHDSEGFLPDLHQLLPDALLQDQPRSQALLEEQDMGWQVPVQLTGLGSHHSVVADSEASPILKQEQMQASPVGLLQEQWSTDFGSGHLTSSAMPPLQQAMSPTSDPHPFMQAAGFLDPQNGSYSKLSGNLSYPSGQGALAERGSATNFPGSRHSMGSQHLGHESQSLSSGMAVTHIHQWPPHSGPSSLLDSSHPYQQSSPMAPDYELGFQFSAPATAPAYLPPSFSAGSARVPPSPFSRQASRQDRAETGNLHTLHPPLTRAPSAFVKGADPVTRRAGNRRGRHDNRSVSMDLDASWRSSDTPGSWGRRNDVLEEIYGHSDCRSRGTRRKLSDLESDVSALKHFGLENMEPGFIEPTIEERMKSLEEDEVPSRSAIQMQRNKSAPSPIPEALLLDEEIEPWQDLSLAAQTDHSVQNVTPEALPRRPLPYRLHEDYAPSWDFVGGGTRMILTCSANETDFEVPMDAALHVSFDFKEVVATVIQPGVVRVIVPPHEAGQVEVMLTLGDGVPLSNPMPFSYRPNPEALSESLSIGASDRELQLHLIKMLSSHSCGGSNGLTGQNGLNMSGSKAIGRQTQSSSSCKENWSNFPLKLSKDQQMALTSHEHSEKLLQNLIDKRILQQIVKKSSDGKLGARPLREISCTSLFDCKATERPGLHLLAGLGYEQSVARLLLAGVNPISQDVEGLTPLHWAAARGKLPTVALLACQKTDSVASIHLDETLETPSGSTAADFAAREGHLGIAAFLGDTQLQQAALTSSIKSERDSTGQAKTTMQRKRSRHPPPPLDVKREFLDPSLDPAECNSVYSLIANARHNAQRIEEGLLRKKAKQAARQQRKAGPQHRSETGQSKVYEPDYVWQDDNDLRPLKGDRRQQDLEGASIFQDLPFADILQAQLQKHSSWSDWDRPGSSGHFSNEDHIFTPGATEEQKLSPCILMALKHVERIATASVAAVQEYVNVRHASQQWLEALQNLEASQPGGHRGPLLTC